jgi:hypothetical protein
MQILRAFRYNPLRTHQRLRHTVFCKAKNRMAYNTGCQTAVCGIFARQKSALPSPAKLLRNFAAHSPDLQENRKVIEQVYYYIHVCIVFFSCLYFALIPALYRNQLPSRQQNE